MSPVMGSFERIEVMRMRKFVYGYLIALQLLVIVGSLNLSFAYSSLRPSSRAGP